MKQPVSIMILGPSEYSAGVLKRHLLAEIPRVKIDVCTSILKAFRNNPAKDYQLIVLDMDFPGIDGIEFIRQLRHYDEMLRIIAVTSDYTLENVFGVMREGVEQFLQKPFNRQRFISAVRSVLNTVKYKQPILHAA